MPDGSDELIGARASEITLPDGRLFRFYVSVARPVCDPRGDWICDLRIVTPEYDRIYPLRGMDSLGAIDSAFFLLREEFREILIRYGVVDRGSALRNLADSELEAKRGTSALPAARGEDATIVLIDVRSFDLVGVDGVTAPLYVSLTRPTASNPGTWVSELHVRFGVSDMTYPFAADNSIACLSLALHRLHVEMRALAPFWPDALFLAPPD